MTNRTKYILGFGIFFIGLFVVYNCTTKLSKNEIIVTVDNSLNIEKVKIEFGFYNSFNLENDSNLTRNGLNKVVFKKTSIPFEIICGENDFYLTYDSRYYTVLRHFIPNDFLTGEPQPHKYHFDIRKKNDNIYLKLKITGQNGEEIEKELMKIEASKENFWGLPKNRTN